MADGSSQSRRSVRLHLDSPTRVYRPGDNITGFLEVTKAAKVPSIVLKAKWRSRSRKRAKFSLEIVPVERSFCGSMSHVKRPRQTLSLAQKCTAPLNSQRPFRLTASVSLLGFQHQRIMVESRKCSGYTGMLGTMIPSSLAKVTLLLPCHQHASLAHEVLR